jgi:NNP family nitrate/nitrite transporter-like MFS transporter
VAEIWAAVLAVMAVVFWFSTDNDPEFLARKSGDLPRKSFAQEFAPLKNTQVWRFALYYFFAFGGFVALSLWLPRYLIGATNSVCASAFQSCSPSVKASSTRQPPFAGAMAQ